MTDRNIAHLHPDLQPLYAQWLVDCQKAGLHVFPTYFWRSVAEQNALYAQGRTVKSSIGPWTTDHPLGSKITNAIGGQSPHNFTLPDGTPASKAFDFGVMKNGTYLTDGSDPLYAQAGKIGEAIGLVWGGEWPKAKRDFDHLELSGWNS